MSSLQRVHPAIYEEFLESHFVVKKTVHAFSKIAIDQAHEQNNAVVKDDGEAIGLTESPTALQRWMVSGPETPDQRDQRLSTQKRFLKDV